MFSSGYMPVVATLYLLSVLLQFAFRRGSSAADLLMDRTFACSVLSGHFADTSAFHRTYNRTTCRHFLLSELRDSEWFKVGKLMQVQTMMYKMQQANENEIRIC